MSYTNGLDKPSDYFNTVLWTGDGTSSRGITGVGYQPDFVWLKRRDSVANQNVYDVIRGATNYLLTDSTNPEATIANRLTSFDSDGFTVGNSGNTNTSGGTYVAWNFLAGGAAVSNTDGSITSSVSASTTSGFSIVSYTGNGTAGATIGHGLSQAPNMIISKRRSGTSNWQVGHDGLTSWDYYLQGLDTTAAQANSNNVWNDTAPSSSFYTVGTNVGTNSSGSTYIAYCFHSVKGFSKFGKYTGNGSTDGTFVYTGFKPAFLITKRSDTSGNSWILTDNARDTDNVVQKVLYPDGSNAEASSDRLDFLSNGFKQRTTSGAANASGGSYIYMCFAENPFVTSTGVPTTAR